LIGYKPERVKMTFHKKGPKGEFNHLTSEWTTYSAPQYQTVQHNIMKEMVTSKLYDENMKEVKTAKETEPRVLHGVDRTK